MSLFISRFIYCNSTSKRQTSIILGPDPTGPCGKSELLETCHWQELNPRPADQEAGMLTPRPNSLKRMVSFIFKRGSHDSKLFGTIFLFHE